MKKLLPFISIVLLFSYSFAQERADLIESITPSSAILFVKTSRIEKLVKSLNYILDNLLPPEKAEELTKEKDEFISKTGIDPLKIESLKSTGIDIDRTISLAYFKKGNHNEGRMILFVPVLNEKVFPLKFVEILKKTNSDREDIDLYPVITGYKNFRIYQIQKDIFTTTIDGVFIVASTGELAKKVIDVKVSNEGYLASDQLYIDYLNRLKGNCDIKAFVRKDFFKSMSRFIKKRNMKKFEKKIPQHHVLKVQHAPINGKNRADSSKVFGLEKGPSPFNAIDYASICLGIKTGRLNLNFAVSLSGISRKMSAILDFFKTGKAGKALYIKNATAYSFLSFDFNRIEELCTEPGPLCGYYTKFKNKIQNELGIDFAKEFLPYFSGVVNAIVGGGRGFGISGSYLIFLPMDSGLNSMKLWKKSRNYLKKRFKGRERFGYKKIGNLKSYWYINDRNKKEFVIPDKRGLYLGNDVNLIKSALQSRNIEGITKSIDLFKRLGENTFFLTYVKKESSINALLLLMAYRFKGLGALLSKIGDIYIAGEKIDNFLSFDLDIEIKNQR